MPLDCQSCGAALRMEDIHSQQGVGVCSYCHAVTKLPAQSETDAEPKPIRPKVARPSAVTVEETIQGLRLTQSWYSPLAWFLLLFCVVWDGFLLFWCAMAFGITALGDGAGLIGGVMFCVPILHVAVGVGLTYFVIACFMNSTVIEVSRESITTSHGPLPWRGGQRLERERIEQLYCEEKVRHGKNGSQTTYNLNAVLKDGTKQKLLSGINELEIVQYIEQTLEKHLGIEDRRVVGEKNG